MSEKIKEQEQQVAGKKNTEPSFPIISARGAGIYDYNDGKTISHIIFPIKTTLEENLVFISKVREEIIKAIASDEYKKASSQESTGSVK